MENNTALLNKENEQQNFEDVRNVLALAMQSETKNATSSANKRTIEYIREKGKVTYNENSPIRRSDIEAKIIDKLGNLQKEDSFDENGIKQDPIAIGRVITINDISGLPNNETSIDLQILDRKYSELKDGFNGLVVKCTSDKIPEYNNKIILWADGSKGFNNFIKPGGANWAKVTVELFNDWIRNDLNMILNGNLPPQFNNARNFLNGVRNGNQNVKITQIGQSLGGALAQLLGAMYENRNIETVTFNATGTAHLIEKLYQYGTLSTDYSNISNYTYSNEIVSKLTAHIGNTYNAYIQHTGELWFHDVYAHMKQDLTYYLIQDYPTIRKILPYGSSISFLILPDGKIAYNICMSENYSYSTIDQIIEALQNAGFLGLSPSLRDFLAINGVSYMIKPGDTIWGICDKYGLTYEELLKLNPWLADRFSEDGKNALIKPGEKLRLPVNSMLTGEDRPTFDVPFDEATKVSPVIYDPILVDLDGDGNIKTTTLENGINFDHGKDGFAESSSWASKEDGVLAIDKNGDGIINDGSEIFGDNYVKGDGKKASSGFDALKDLDSNNDGVIDVNDAEFNNIKILKGDGSLVSLNEAGIVSISLSSKASGVVDENGNTLISSGTFVREDGSVGSLGDFNLVVEKAYSKATNTVFESKGNDVIHMRQGDDLVYGGNGNDSIDGNKYIKLLAA